MPVLMPLIYPDAFMLDPALQKHKQVFPKHLKSYVPTIGFQRDLCSLFSKLAEIEVQIPKNGTMVALVQQLPNLSRLCFRGSMSLHQCDIQSY